MKHPFRPDREFDAIADVTPEVLKAMGIRALLCDLDNTLVAPRTRYPTRFCVEWLEAMRRGGVRVMLVANNSRRRVRDFCRSLPFDGQAEARKPLPFGLTRARLALHARASETAFLGDQLFTDVLGARLAGVRALYVPPLVSDEGWFFRLKRRLERPFLKRRHPVP